MKKWEKEIVQKQISDEQKVIWRMRDSYKLAMKDVKERIAILQSREQTQSVIYQLKYQQELQKQLETIYAKMSSEWYTNIDDYLKGCYEDGFYSTMYSIHNQGIPIILPFNQEEMVQMAAQSDYEGIKLSEKLYSDSVEMARISRQEMTRGLATNASYADIARIVEKRGEAGFYNAMRIVRTESHRIHNEVRLKTMMKAKEEGADVVKQWDSTVDKRTRPHHVELDGQLRELDQPFKIPSTGATAMKPGGFGKAAEDINCRCEMLQRARWALDKSEIDKCVGDLSNATEEQLQAWADKLGVTKDELIKASNGIIEPDGTINHSIKAKNYNDFKMKYKKKAEEKAAEKKEVPVPAIEDTRSKFKKAIDGVKEKIARRGGIIEESDIMEAGKAFREDLEETTLKDYRIKKEEVETLHKQYSDALHKEKLAQDALSEYEFDLFIKETTGATEIEDFDIFDFLTEEASESDKAKIDEHHEKLKKRVEETRNERKTLHSKLFDADREAQSILSNATRDKLSEIRSVGIGDIDIDSHLKGRSPMRKTVKNAYDVYPTDWVKRSAKRGSLTPKTVERGYYSDWEQVIAISEVMGDGGYETAVHELGHRMEYSIPGIKDAERAFYARRTAGESLEWMGTGYNRNEKTRKDNFLNKYMGKDYGGNAFELVSTGFQYAFCKPDLLVKDADMAEWIFGLLSIY